MRQIQCITLLALVLAAPNLKAQLALPPDITSFDGEVLLRFVPNTKALCLKTSRARLPDGSMQEKRTKDTLAVAEESNGDLNWTGSRANDDGLMNLMWSIRKDGMAFAQSQPVVMSSTGIAQADQNLLSTLLGVEGQAQASFLGKSWRAGMVAPPQFSAMCKAMGTKLSDSSGGYKVLGLTSIDGRSALVFAGKESVACQVDGGGPRAVLVTEGWIAFDRSTGLVLRSSAKGSSSFFGTKLEAVDSYSCSVSAATMTAIAVKPAVRPEKPTTTAEERLERLKQLLDKRLISKEQYELKSVEILKDL